MIAYYAGQWAGAIAFTLAIWLTIEAGIWAVGFYRRGMERVRRYEARGGK